MAGGEPKSTECCVLLECKRCSNIKTSLLGFSCTRRLSGTVHRAQCMFRLSMQYFGIESLEGILSLNKNEKGNTE